MGWESFGVVGFDLGPLLQGQTRLAKLKSAYNPLILLEILCMSRLNYVPSGDTLRRDAISSFPWKYTETKNDGACTCGKIII